MKPSRILPLCAFLLPAGGCSGVQSALQPSGREAAEIGGLFWTVTGLSAFVTLLVILLLVVALWGPRSWRRQLGREWIIFAGGIVFPVVTLSLLLGYGLFVLQAGYSRSGGQDTPDITIEGERWWWRVTYHGEAGTDVASANELRLPVGQDVSVRLITDNVIHSFWVPRLAGKLDMIPGRSNVITLRATQAGVSRGQCAEYCGGAHALMSFYVVALDPADYARWREDAAAPAREPQTAQERRGQRLFLDNGCGACHAIRGTEADGRIGPDLTHLGSRRSLAAAALPNNPEAIARWIRDNQHIKPENLMPAFGQFSPDELDALATYLWSLK
ncbi:MAG: c-type cytochrome [Flavobacteriaceae bacterium]